MSGGPVHRRLVATGARWLRREGFGVVATELVAIGSKEQPDVIGFRASCSAVIEVKASRSDFLVDHRKPHRAGAGLGTYRFYLCPQDVIAPGELLRGWGLLYAVGRTVVAVSRPMGNRWPAHDALDGDDWKAFAHVADPVAERSVLYSIARRLTAAQSGASL